MKITVINHTNGTYSNITEIRYIDLKHNMDDVIEIHVNKDCFIPKEYRQHKPHRFSAELIDK